MLVRQEKTGDESRKLQFGWVSAGPWLAGRRFIRPFGKFRPQQSPISDVMKKELSDNPDTLKHEPSPKRQTNF